MTDRPQGDHSDRTAAPTVAATTSATGSVNVVGPTLVNNDANNATSINTGSSTGAVHIADHVRWPQVFALLEDGHVELVEAQLADARQRVLQRQATKTERGTGNVHGSPPLARPRAQES